MSTLESTVTPSGPDEPQVLLEYEHDPLQYLWLLLSPNLRSWK